MTTTTVTNDTPRIYAACLASYNAGILHGEWIDADQCADEIQDDVNKMLRASTQPNIIVNCPFHDGEGYVWNEEMTETHSVPLRTNCQCKGTGKLPSAEEWAVHDYDNMVDLGEYPAVAEISIHGQAIALADEPAAYLAYFDHVGDCENFEEAWNGEWDSEQAFAEELIEDMGMVHGGANELIAQYFDYEAWTRDLFMSDYFSTECPNGGVYVFRNL